MRIRGLLMCGALGAVFGAGLFGSAAAAAPVTVPTSTTVSVSPASVHPWEPVTVTATVTTTAGLTPTGTVDVTRGSQSLCSGVVVDPVTGEASCTATGPLAVGAGLVRATFTSAAGAGFGTSSARTSLPAVAWTPVLTATAVAGTPGCTQGQALRFVVGAPKSAAATAPDLPAATGTVSGPPVSLSTFEVTVTDGVATICAPVYTRQLTWTYSGDANYRATRANLAIASPNHAGRGGSGAPTEGPTAGPTGTTVPTLAATGSSPVPAVAIGLALLVVGGGLLAVARARRET